MIDAHENITLVRNDSGVCQIIIAYRYGVDIIGAGSDCKDFVFGNCRYIDRSLKHCCLAQWHCWAGICHTQSSVKVFGIIVYSEWFSDKSCLLSSYVARINAGASSRSGWGRHHNSTLSRFAKVSITALILSIIWSVLRRAAMLTL